MNPDPNDPANEPVISGPTVEAAKAAFDHLVMSNQPVVAVMLIPVYEFPDTGPRIDCTWHLPGSNPQAASFLNALAALIFGYLQHVAQQGQAGAN